MKEFKETIHIKVTIREVAKVAIGWYLGKFVVDVGMGVANALIKKATAKLEAEAEKLKEESGIKVVKDEE